MGLHRLAVKVHRELALALGLHPWHPLADDPSPPAPGGAGGDRSGQFGSHLGDIGERKRRERDDIEEAVVDSRLGGERMAATGEAAVRAAIEGKSGLMVKIVRQTQPDGSIQWCTGLQPLEDIANVEHFVPRDWISEDGYLPNEKFVEYAKPLIEGEVRPPAEGGLPKYIVLEKVPLEKKLTPRE